MDKKFNIVISAVDKATAVVRKVKSSFSQVTRPLADIKTSVVSLGKETGLDKVGKSLLDISHAAGSVASKMAGVMPIIGGSGIGIAGITAATSKWADMGAEVKRTSRIFGVTTKELQELRGASNLAEVGPEAMDSTLRGLGSTMQDVFYYRATPQAMTALRQMGIQFHRTAQGAPLISDGLDQIADAVKRLEGNTQAQRTLLNALGISEDMLPVLEGGATGLRKLREEYAKTKAAMSDSDVEGASELVRAAKHAGLALWGAAERKLSHATVLTKGFDRIADFAEGNGPNPWTKNFKERFVPSLSTVVKAPWYAMMAPYYAAKWAFSSSDTPAETPQSQDAPGAVPVMPGSSVQGGIPAPMPSSSAGIYINSPAPSPTAVGDAAAAMSPKVSIELLLKNAPAGMTAKARANDGSDVPTRVEYSMPTTVLP